MCHQMEHNPSIMEGGGIYSFPPCPFVTSPRPQTNMILTDFSNCIVLRKGSSKCLGWLVHHLSGYPDGIRMKKDAHKGENKKN